MSRGSTITLTMPDSYRQKLDEICTERATTASEYLRQKIREDHAMLFGFSRKSLDILTTNAEKHNFKNINDFLVHLVNIYNKTVESARQ